MIEFILTGALLLVAFVMFGTGIAAFSKEGDDNDLKYFIASVILFIIIGTLVS